MDTTSNLPPGHFPINDLDSVTREYNVRMTVPTMSHSDVMFAYMRKTHTGMIVMDHTLDRRIPALLTRLERGNRI